MPSDNGIISEDIIRAEVRIGNHTILRSNNGIISEDIIRAEVRIGNHTILRSNYGIISEDMKRRIQVLLSGGNYD
jgi:UDP-3-O-[3-hydroxymyristoyl] glucosamine N-acyltransferase